MPKSESDVVKEFNEIVNMTSSELEAFLKTEGSQSTGWSKGDGSGESVGHESGRKIVDILKRNPKKDPSKYTDADKEHMRKVVSYCSRHLAQEDHLKQSKGKKELEESKSTRSLKNWGHDPLKTMKGGAKPTSKKEDKPDSKKEEKPASKKETKPTSKKADKPASAPAKKDEKKDEKPVSKPKSSSKKAEAETGEKRAAEEKTAEKPASKKAKTANPPSEGSRKPPSRGAKKT